MRLLMNDSDYPMAEKRVVLFTDGISECVDDGTGAFECHFNDATVRQSIDEAVTHVMNEYVEQEIKLSVILVGNFNTPHEVLRKAKTGGGCMGRADALELNTRLVDIASGTVTVEQAYHSGGVQTNGVGACKKSCVNE
jgi:hypothetical protein